MDPPDPDAMSAQPAPAPRNATQAAHHRNLVEFLDARAAQWAQLQEELDPDNALIASLNALWTQEWMQSHADIFAARARATAGLGIAELNHYGTLGGLKQCVIELRARGAELERLAGEKQALEQALQEIAGQRHAYLGQQTSEQMLDKIALIAHEALAYGRPAARPVDAGAQTPAQAAAQEEPAQEAANAPTAAVEEEAPGEAAGTPAGEVASERTDAIPIGEGMQVFTAQKFRVMADVRGLSPEDGEAYAATAETYDGATRIDPREPIPPGVSHVAWKEYAASP